MSRIKELFLSKNEKVIPFITAGYPNKQDTLPMILAAEEAGAAMVEIGMPFSDPLADGPIIQNASQVAIENGVNIYWILELVSEIRKHSQIPIALMGYINPIIKYGLKYFLSDCKKSGVDGLIIPDLPPEEASEYIKITKEYNLSPILLVAPNTSEKRIMEISHLAGDLIYCVAILGITGSSSQSSSKLINYLKRVEKNSKCPYIVGFGIKDRSDVININKLAHGAVIGSAIIGKLENCKNPSKIMKDYIKGLVNG